MQPSSQIAEDSTPEPVEPLDPSQATLYDLLEVSPRASQDVIKAAYRALARSVHPDLNRSRSAAERMRELNRARDVLADPRRRTVYDLSIGQQRSRKFTEAGLEGVRRAHSCWRCSQLLNAFAPYCGTCRWLVCDSCQACGCQRNGGEREPNLDDSPLLERVGPLTRLGWLFVGAFIFALMLFAITVWAVALR